MMSRLTTPLAPVDVPRHISKGGFVAQSASESVPSFFARLRRAYSPVRGELTAMGKGYLIPHHCRLASL